MDRIEDPQQNLISGENTTDRNFLSFSVQSRSAIDRIENPQQNLISGENTTDRNFLSFSAQSCLRIDRIENRQQFKSPLRLLVKRWIYSRTLEMDEK